MHLDDIDKRLLNLIQSGFPLAREPFSALGQEMGMPADATLDRVIRLKGEGIIRYIGPIMDARRLGYRSTLAAMQVPEERLEQAACIVSRHPGVSHNYARNHLFNLWFTLSVSPKASLEEELQGMGRSAGAEAVLNLPALRVFKLRAYFDLVGEDSALPQGSSGGGSVAQRVELSPAERAVINELQQDVTLIPRPFDHMAERLGMDIDEFLDTCRSLEQRGIVRRFSAAIKHDRVGFGANVMACWIAPPSRLERAGGRLAALPEVSHCYERRTGTLWPYNLFAMIHGRSPEACQRIVQQVSQETSLTEYQLLFSIKEFKKARVRYVV